MNEEEGIQPISPADSADNQLADELLNHHVQRRRQKGILFWIGIAICASMFGIFCYALLGCDRMWELVDLTPFSLAPLSILGLTPVIMLILLFRCVFRPAKNNGFIDKNDMETIKEIISIFKSSN